MSLGGASWELESPAERTPVTVYQVVERMGGKVQYGLYNEQHPHLRHSCERVQLLSHNLSCLPDDLVESVGVPHPQTGFDNVPSLL